MTRRPLNTVANELLVLRCQGGDERALAVLYEHWSPRLARHAARMTGRSDAVADVCQDTWLAIARGLKRLDDPARFPAWAYRIVTRRSADWIRQRRRLAATTTTLTREPAGRDDETAGDDEVAALRQALRRLTPEHQAVIALFYGDGLGLETIAEALDIPTGTVKSRLHHGRQALSAILERQPS